MGGPKKELDLDNNFNEEDDDSAMDCMGSESEGLQNPQAQTYIHPLFMEHVAIKVFTFIGWNYSSKDLLACRQVCRLWYDIISNGVKRRDKAPELTWKYEDTTRLEQFINSMRLTTNLPFDKYSFDTHFFVDQHTKLFGSFLSLFSPFITSLTMTFGKQYSLDLQSLDLSPTAFPNLKSLTFKCSHVSSMPGMVTKSACTWFPIHPQKQLEGLLSLLKGILTSAGQLEFLEFYMPPRYIEGDSAKLADLEFGDLLAHHVPETVVNLNVTMRLNDSHLGGWLRLRLKSLHLNFYGSQISGNCLQTFLNRHSATLLELRLVDYESIYVDWNKVLPEFTTLSKLEVKDNQFHRYHPPSYFPSLEKLVLVTGHSDASKRELETSSFVYASVREISLQYTIGSLNLHALQHIPSYFPNVTILRIHANQDSARAIEKIFEVMRNLKELEIMFFHLASKYAVDPMITGLPPAKCDIIRDNNKYDSHSQAVVLAEIRRKSCLENLPCLERLTLNVTSPSILLTDVSVHYGLFRSPSLLVVSFKGHHNISPECMELMTMRLQVFEDDVQKLPYVAPSMDYSMALVPFNAD